jgi:hypothetical protein
MMLAPLPKTLAEALRERAFTAIARLNESPSTPARLVSGLPFSVDANARWKENMSDLMVYTLTDR